MQNVNKKKRPAPALSERDRAVLQIEQKWGASPTALRNKLDEAREQLELTPEAYHLILRGLVDDDAALAAAPELIGHLRRLRDQRNELDPANDPRPPMDASP